VRPAKRWPNRSKRHNVPPAQPPTSADSCKSKAAMTARTHIPNTRPSSQGRRRSPRILLPTTQLGSNQSQHGGSECAKSGPGPLGRVWRARPDSLAEIHSYVQEYDGAVKLQPLLTWLLVNACDPQNFEPNLALNLEIADMINAKKGNAYGLNPKTVPWRRG
jgi:hypothetical protein